MHVVVHGHFYQPPRESPWTDFIPRQESAAPWRDWNARITDECYRPNACSRVKGAGDRIEDIVNNYAHISFDFGPTLLNWIARHRPRVYRRILEGDRLSRELHAGHGSAIAHVYNHVIMPLANYRDKQTQILWGLRDFEWRFGRQSESIWLAETAVNLETARLLIEHGIRYIILSPYQARRWRPLDRAGGWRDARDAKIDPRRPYRFFLKDSRRRRQPDRYLDVFFYDGPLASDVSFNHLLRSAPGFAERLIAAAGETPTESTLVHVATDGEVYGHHEPFGDMCLSYLIRREAPRRGLRFTTYGRYLQEHPPTHEVELNFGEHDEGSAWSCAHGVGRWERDCGCSTGAPAGWNQKWRTPLRRGFDMARDRLVEAFLEQLAPLLHDPWAARDDYILPLLDPRSRTRDAFLEQHARRPLQSTERERVWSLLESQRFAMFMYTSCAWFFADISGIETVQNMAYACRAIELARPWTQLDVEQKLLEYLAEADSNVVGMGTGADVYRRFVEPQRVSAVRVAGDLALAAAVLHREPETRRLRYDVRVVRFERRTESAGDAQGERFACRGELELRDRDTEAAERFAVHVYRTGLADVRCYVLPHREGAQSEAQWPEEAEVAGRPGAARLELSDLVTEGRERVVRTAFEAILDRQEAALETIFNESRGFLSILRGAGIAVAPVLRAVAGHVLARRLEEVSQGLEVAFLQGVVGDPDGGAEAAVASRTEEIAGLFAFAEEAGIKLPVEALREAYSAVLEQLLEMLQREADPRRARQTVAVIESSYRFHFPLDRRRLEDLAFQALKKHRNVLLESVRARGRGAEATVWAAFSALADVLHLSIRAILEIDEQGEIRPEAAEDGSLQPSGGG